jgi:hypothetical protein
LKYFSAFLAANRVAQRRIIIIPQGRQGAVDFMRPVL